MATPATITNFDRRYIVPEVIAINDDISDLRSYNDNGNIIQEHILKF